MRLALYQPDNPMNVGAAIRLAACFDVALDVIRPCGFPLSARELNRAAMDYRAQAEMVLHDDWQHFLGVRPAGARLVLLTTSGAEPHTEFRYQPDDILLLGRESSGVPDHVHDLADARVVVPMAPGARSLNVVVSGAVVLAEALRQQDEFSRFIKDAERNKPL